MKKGLMALAASGALLFSSGVAAAQGPATAVAGSSVTSTILQDDDDIDRSAWLGIGVFIAIVAIIYFVAESDDGDPTSP